MINSDQEYNLPGIFLGHNMVWRSGNWWPINGKEYKAGFNPVMTREHFLELEISVWGIPRHLLQTPQYDFIDKIKIQKL